MSIRVRPKGLSAGLIYSMFSWMVLIFNYKVLTQLLNMPMILQSRCGKMELISYRKWRAIFEGWSENNSMSSNPGKSKELTIRKKGFVEELCKIHNILQYSELKLLGVIFQYNCKYASHVSEKVVKANKCLHEIRTLRHEGYNQEELDYLFQSIVMPQKMDRKWSQRKIRMAWTQCKGSLCQFYRYLKKSG